MKTFKVIVEGENKAEFEIEAKDTLTAEKIGADEYRKLPVIVSSEEVEE